jgi:hypothetical protein
MLLRMKRAELLALMPASKTDADAARGIVRLGYPTVAPVLRDMILWLRVGEAPVADIFSRFFAELAPPPIELIRQGLRHRSLTLRGRLLEEVLPGWPRQAVEPLAAELTALASQPDAADNDLSGMELLLRHGLVERGWLRQWVAFRLGQTIRRGQRLEDLQRRLEEAPGP